jgi:hypothetical protein
LGALLPGGIKGTLGCVEPVAGSVESLLGPLAGGVGFG